MVSTNEPYLIFFLWCPPHGLLVKKMAYLGSLYGQSTFNNHLNIHYPYPLETYFPSFVLRLRWPTNGESQLFIPSNPTTTLKNNLWSTSGMNLVGRDYLTLLWPWFFLSYLLESLPIFAYTSLWLQSANLISH